MYTFSNFLSAWLILVALMAFGNTLQCLLEEDFLSKKLYDSTDEVTSLLGRVFASLTCLSALLRFICGLNIYVKSLYFVTLVSFKITILHLILETFYYKTCSLSMGTITSFIISSLSVIFMCVGYRFVDKDRTADTLQRNSSVKKLLANYQLNYEKSRYS